MFCKRGEEEHAFLQNTFAWFGSVCSIPLLSTSRIFLPDEAFYQPLFISEKSVPGKHQNNEENIFKVKNKDIVNPKLVLHVFLVPEAVTRRCSVKEVFLEILQNSQENTCARVAFSIKLQALGLQLF